MITITRSWRLTLIGILLAAAALPGTAWAIPSGSHYMVSPPSCQPVDATSANRLYLVNGVWTFRSGQSGYAELSCPINFSGSAGQWTLVQLWYRDGFTSVGSNNGYVEGDLMMRERGGSGSTQLLFTASTYGNGAEYGFDTNASVPVGPNNFEMYYLRVRLNRTNTSRSVAFIGFEIRF